MPFDRLIAPLMPLSATGCWLSVAVGGLPAAPKVPTAVDVKALAGGALARIGADDELAVHDLNVASVLVVGPVALARSVGPGDGGRRRGAQLGDVEDAAGVVLVTLSGDVERSAVRV